VPFFSSKDVQNSQNKRIYLLGVWVGGLHSLLILIDIDTESEGFLFRVPWNVHDSKREGR